MRKRVLIGTELGGAEILTRILGNVYDLVFAKDIPHAIALAKQLKPDLIICDLLFESSGVFELLAAIRKDPALNEIPYICAQVQPSGMHQSLVSSFELVCRDRLDCTFIDVLEMSRAQREDHLAALLEELINKRGFGNAQSESPVKDKAPIRIAE